MKFCGGSFLNVSVLAMWVLVEASDKGEELEISVGDLITTNVGSSISKSRFEAVCKSREDGNDGLLLLGGGIVLHNSIALGLLKNVKD